MAKRWYAELLGMEPYFERSGGSAAAAYYEFRRGDYQHELGLIDRRYAPEGSATGPGGVIVDWHVDDVPAALAKLLAMGAQEHEAATERGAGFITASAGILEATALDDSFPDLRGQLAGLLGGTVNLVQFQRWIGLNSVALELFGSNEDVALLNLVAGLLDEYTGDYIDASELVGALQTAPLVQKEVLARRSAVA